MNGQREREKKPEQEMARRDEDKSNGSGTPGRRFLTAPIVPESQSINSISIIPLQHNFQRNC
jgi:hypothetical protein